MNPLSRLARVSRITSLVTLMLFLPLAAEAAVHKEGAWPASDKKVSFEFEGKPSDGLVKLAEEAGWSLVMSKGITVSEHDVKINVEDQPADAVLDALFAESDVVARRNGTLLTITATSSAPGSTVTPPSAPAGGVPSIPAVPPVPTVRGEDRNILGSSLVVGKDEVVHTVTVTGGSAKIYGIVTGDLVVAGGSARIEDGGRVVGNATVFGGSLRVVSGARVDGDVGIVGGALKREEGAIIGGEVVDSANGQHGDVNVTMKDGEVSTGVGEGRQRTSGRARLTESVHSFGQSVTNMSLLFVFGCVLLALGTRKMEVLRVEAAARPMKAFAMGIVGAICALIAIAAMCVTLVGIPFAVMVVLLGVFSVYASIAALLTTVGAAVAGHKSKNPYVHLLVGCVLFLLAGLLPYVGGLVTAAVVLIAIGTLVTTRLAGIVDGRARRPEMV
jgi:hypothetical protein